MPDYKTLFCSSLLGLAFVAMLSAFEANDHSSSLPSVVDGDAWVDSVFATLSLEQKVGQMFAVRASGRLYNERNKTYRDLVEMVEMDGIGGLIFFRGEPLAQAVLTNDMQERAPIPLLISEDMEWGVGMRLPNTTTFPRAMALGATRNPDLAYAMGRVVAREARALGVHVNYAPVVDVNNNPHNPVINVRSFGEDPILVGSMAAAYTRGMQDGGLLATAKHFPGHGDTDDDSHSSLPVLHVDRARLDSVELIPFKAAIAAGVSSIMVAHIALPELDQRDDLPATLSPLIVTGILRNELGFDGLIVSDALRMRGITNKYGPGDAAVRAINAGVDQLLLSADFYAARRAVLHAVDSGQISIARIDQAVIRILQAKARAGLHNYSPVDIDAIRVSVNDEESAALSGEVARNAVTLLLNKQDIIPLRDQSIRILDITISDSRNADAGISFNRQLREYAPDAMVSHILLDRRSHGTEFERALKRSADYDLVIVQSHLLVRTGSEMIGLDNQQQEFMEDLIAGDAPVIVVALGNPYMIMGIGTPDAYIAAYGSSKASERAVIQGIVGQIGFSGRLPVSIPGHFEIGAGLTTEQVSIRIGSPEDVGMHSDSLARLDTLLWHAIEDSAFPGAALTIGRGDVVVASEGFGYLTYNSEVHVTPHSLFDLASLTKVVATTPAVMLLYDRGLIELDEPLATYLPEFGGGGKAQVTVRQVLTHTSGLTPFYSFEQMGITNRDEIIAFIGDDELEYEPDTQYRYSDLGMIMMVLAIERITGEEFGTFIKTSLYEPLAMHDTGFRPAGGLGIDSTVVPTEVDTLFRMRLVQGEVHDERAWMLGGTAGHAGLFSTASDLARYASMLLNRGVGNGQRIFKPETVDLFTTRFQNDLGHTRALGWDTKSATGYSSAGSHFGPRSYGHTGFTGTSIWMDPDENVFVVLLTNRVYPTRANRKLFAVRPRVADIVFTSITGPAALDVGRYGLPGKQNP